MNLPWAAAQSLTRTHRCRCGGELVAATDPEHHGKRFIVRCGKCRATDPEAFKPILSYYQLWKQGKLDNPYIAARLRHMEEKEMTEKLETQVGEEKAQALMPYRNLPKLTETQANLILDTLWPKVPNTVKAHALLLCTQLQLNPLRKHLYIVPYKTRDGGLDWSILMSIEANRELARRVSWFSYLDGPRLMTEKEQVAYFGDFAADRLRAITVLTDHHGGRYPGYGEIAKGAAIQGADKGNSYANMARVRSERQALAKLAGDQDAGLMQGVEVMEAQYIPTDSGLVDTGTGEIIESEGRTLEEDIFEEPNPPPNLITAEQKDNLENLADVKGRLKDLRFTLKQNGWTMDTLTVEQYENLERRLRKVPDRD